MLLLPIKGWRHFPFVFMCKGTISFQTHNTLLKLFFNKVINNLPATNLSSNGYCFFFWGVISPQLFHSPFL